MQVEIRIVAHLAVQEKGASWGGGMGQGASGRLLIPVY